MLKDSPAGYGLITIVLHWISALLIIFLLALGVYMTGLDYYDEWYHKGPTLHISLGLLLLFMFTFRLLWRVYNPTPVALDANHKANVAATLVKIALYFLTFAVLISGYFITTAEGQAASMFDWLHIPATLQLDAQGVDIAGEIHEWLAWAILGVAIVHGGAAFMHHFFLRDRTLVRMLKPVKKSDH